MEWQYDGLRANPTLHVHNGWHALVRADTCSGAQGYQVSRFDSLTPQMVRIFI